MSMSITIGPPSTPAKSQPHEMQKIRLKSDENDLRRDSGYFTQSQTPDRSTQQSSRSSSNAVHRIAYQARVLKSGAKPCNDLSEFDVPVDDATIHRFTNIQSQIEQPLLRYVQKTPGKYRAMAIRLMVLGTSAAEAKPHIVVLAAEEQCKRVRKFFDKASVQTLVRPCDETLPSFEVLIYGRPPDPKQAEDDDIDVLVPLINGDFGFTADTFCGAPIVIRHPLGVEKRATFGGIIKAVDNHGNLRLYGLTAGHVIDESDDHLSTHSASDLTPGSDDLFLSDSESDLDSASETESEINEMHEPVGEESACSSGAEIPSDSEKVLMYQDSSTSWSALELGEIGVISKGSPQGGSESSQQASNSSAYYDWALIELSKYKPNRLRPRTVGADDASQPVATTSGDLVMPRASLLSKGIKKSVVVMSGSEGPKRGSISALPSRILLGPGKEFVDTLIVNLDADKEIVDGDSGSWVVNETSLEVYGHIVAADAFGGGYIIPLENTLRDIKNCLQVDSVEVASLIDIASIVMEKMTLMSNDFKPRELSHPITPPPPEEVPLRATSRNKSLKLHLTHENSQDRREKDDLAESRVESEGHPLDIVSLSCSSDMLHTATNEGRWDRRRFEIVDHYRRYVDDDLGRDHETYATRVDRDRSAQLGNNWRLLQSEDRERSRYDRLDVLQDTRESTNLRPRYDDMVDRRRGTGTNRIVIEDYVNDKPVHRRARSISDSAYRSRSLDNLRDGERDQDHQLRAEVVTIREYGRYHTRYHRDRSREYDRRRRDENIVRYHPRSYRNAQERPSIPPSPPLPPRAALRGSQTQFYQTQLPPRTDLPDSGYGTARNSARSSGGDITGITVVYGERKHGQDSGYGTGRSSAVHSTRNSTGNSRENTPRANPLVIPSPTGQKDVTGYPIITHRERYRDQDEVMDRYQNRYMKGGDARKIRFSDEDDA